MGMSKKWDLLSEQNGALAVLAAAFLTGGAAGCLLAALSGGAGAEELSSYLADYLTLAQQGELPRSHWPVLWDQVKYLLAALILGLTALGLAGFPILFWVRGFFFSWTARSVVGARSVYGGRARFPLRPAAASEGSGRRKGRTAAQRRLLVPGRAVCGPGSGGGTPGVLGSPGTAAGDCPSGPVNFCAGS